MSKSGGMSRSFATMALMIFSLGMYGSRGRDDSLNQSRSKKTQSAGGATSWTPSKKRRGKTHGSVSRMKMKRHIQCSL